MKNFVVAVIVIILVTGGIWWYLNQNPNGVGSTGKIVVPLADQNASGQKGTATLEETTAEINGVSGKVVRLTIKVTSASQDASQPAHIHTGSCASLGQPVFPLTAVINGSSVTDIHTTLNEIKASRQPLAVNIHKSEAEIGTSVACGDVPVVTAAPN